MATDVPVEGDSQVTPPHGVPSQNNASTNAVGGMHVDGRIQHEQSLLPVCRPGIKTEDLSSLKIA